MTEKRASKKQRELLGFIESFIKENEYGPSYREIMRALDYRSVSTVAVHVDGLISNGLLRKRDNSARSLEVVSDDTVLVSASKPNHEAWLRGEIDRRLVQLEAKEDVLLRREVTVLEDAVKILGLGVKPATDV